MPESGSAFYSHWPGRTLVHLTLSFIGRFDIETQRVSRNADG